MNKAELIASVAGDLNTTEQALDVALTHATTLVQSMISSRAALSISPVAGADAQARALEAITALSSARQAMVACHLELAKDHRRMGWGVYAEGPLDKGTGGTEGTGPKGEYRLRAV